MGGFRVEGSWPSPIVLRRGWGQATARPWNDDVPDAFLRLIRGRSDFLRAATATVARIGGAGVISPAVFNSSMKIWQSAGYHEVRQLEVMERSLGDDLCQPRSEVDEVDSPDWNRLTAIDNAAFRGFWRMSREGLKEALQSTSSSAVLVSRTNTRVTGYAIAGAQWGIGYLQRVAVDPDSGGQGLGTDLVRASLKWAAFAGARTMVLNVRPENERAKRVYNRAGLTYTGTNLHILRHGDFEAST